MRHDIASETTVRPLAKRDLRGKRAGKVLADDARKPLLGMSLSAAPVST
jgi:hypothetical protein